MPSENFSNILVVQRRTATCSYASKSNGNGPGSDREIQRHAYQIRRAQRKEHGKAFAPALRQRELPT